MHTHTHNLFFLSHPLYDKRTHTHKCSTNLRTNTQRLSCMWLWAAVTVCLQCFSSQWWLMVAAGGECNMAPIPRSFNTILSVVTWLSFQKKDQISKTASGKQKGRVGYSDRKGEGAWLEMKEQQRKAWSRKLWSVGLGVLSLPWLTRWHWQRVLLVNKHQDIQQISSFKMREVCRHLRSSFIPLSVILSLLSKQDFPFQISKVTLMMSPEVCASEDIAEGGSASAHTHTCRQANVSKPTLTHPNIHT